MSLLGKIWFSSLVWFPMMAVFLDFADPGSPIAQIWGVAYLGSVAYYIGKDVGASEKKKELEGKQNN